MIFRWNERVKRGLSFELAWGYLLLCWLFKRVLKWTVHLQECSFQSSNWKLRKWLNFFLFSENHCALFLTFFLCSRAILLEMDSLRSTRKIFWILHKSTLNLLCLERIQCKWSKKAVCAMFKLKIILWAYRIQGLKLSSTHCFFLHLTVVVGCKRMLECDIIIYGRVQEFRHTDWFIIMTRYIFQWSGLHHNLFEFKLENISNLDLRSWTFGMLTLLFLDNKSFLEYKVWIYWRVMKNNDFFRWILKEKWWECSRWHF